jgi:predicted transposase YbfD/YdcC
MDTDNIRDKNVYDVFNEYFAHIDDPRQAHKIHHLLSEILFITVLAVIAGADDFNEIARYAKVKYHWLTTFLKLPGGVPSHDTFNRVLCMIDAEQFQQSFVDWVNDIRNSIKIPGINEESLEDKDVISVDGKTVRNSKDQVTGKKAIHMVSALSSKYGLVLGQQKCYEKSNEITAIPQLLDMLLVEGSVITIDAMGCQKAIAAKIMRRKADYILALKGNQGNLYKEVTDLFDKVNTQEFKKYVHQMDTQLEKDHGRIEQRDCVTIENLGWLSEIQQWPGVKSIAKITATVVKGEQQYTENRYYISSLPGKADFINRAVRKHWFVENKLHWILDVIFKEDYCRVRTGNGAENLNTIRKIALNTIKRDNTVQTSFKNKRKMCAWNDNFALNILKNMKA